MTIKRNFDLDSLTKNELINLKESLSKTSRDDLVLKALINNKLKEKEAKILNSKFDFNKFEVIPSYEKAILDYNGITNLQQLIEADLNKIIDSDGCAIGTHSKEFLSWARRVYDMSSSVNISNKNKSKKTLVKNK